MSEVMLCDSLQINGVNPFWSEPPGAWSRPHKYTPSVQNTIEREPEELDYDPRGVEHKCPLTRPLYPRRNIDGGLWTIKSSPVERETPFEMNKMFILALVIILVILILQNMS